MGRFDLEAKNYTLSQTVHRQAHCSDESPPTLPKARSSKEKSSQGESNAAAFEGTLYRTVLRGACENKRRESFWKVDHLLRRNRLLEGRAANERVEREEHQPHSRPGRRVPRLQDCDRIHVRRSRLRPPPRQHRDHQPRQLPRLPQGLAANKQKNSACTFPRPVVRPQNQEGAGTHAKPKHQPHLQRRLQSVLF